MASPWQSHNVVPGTSVPPSVVKLRFPPIPQFRFAEHAEAMRAEFVVQVHELAALQAIYGWLAYLVSSSTSNVATWVSVMLIVTHSAHLPLGSLMMYCWIIT
jgi:hypothetical protein